MDTVLLIGLFTGVLTGAVQAGTSVMYAALGEVIVERAGVVNLGVEGSMLMGASVGFAVTFQSGNPWVGAAAGTLAAGIFSLAFAYLVVTRKANQLASGLTLGFLGIGLSALIGKPYVGQDDRRSAHCRCPAFRRCRSLVPSSSTTICSSISPCRWSC